MNSEVVNAIDEIVFGLSSQDIGSEFCELSGVHHRGRYSNGTLPVKVVEALEVGKLPEGIFREFGVVTETSVLGWCADTSVAVLCTEEEFEEILADDFLSNEGSGNWVIVAILSWIVGLLVEFLADLFVDLEEGKFGFVASFVLSESVDDGIDFHDEGLLDITFSESLSVDDHVVWEFLVRTHVRFDGFLYDL